MARMQIPGRLKWDQASVSKPPSGKGKIVVPGAGKPSTTETDRGSLARKRGEWFVVVTARLFRCVKLAGQKGKEGQIGLLAPLAALILPPARHVEPLGPLAHPLHPLALETL